MIGSLGLALGVAALGASLLGLWHSLRAHRTGGSVGPARRAAWVVVTAAVGAGVVMVVALVIRDFSIAYVAQVGSRSMPLLFTVASLWGALEGSILFWAALLAVFTVLLAIRTGSATRPLLPVALAVLFGLSAFFQAVILVASNPWWRVDPVPPDGPGPNPLLQNHPLVAVHPPLLYLGLVGLAVPFALTIAALLTGRFDESWVAAARRWMLGSWVCLTLGLILGAWWSYAVLGWGGYWAWDPVENVALLPWLTSTAFLHSAMVSARRGSLLGWNVLLVVASFSLTLVATLVTRSGILNSVHSFTQSAIGPLFLALLSATLVGSAGLIVLRLSPGPGSGARGTRTAAFLLNNVVLVATAGVVLIGTLFPLFAEAATGRQVSVGAPYFERIVGPMAIGLLVLLGIGPSLPWGGWSAAARARLMPGTLAAAATAVLLAVGRASPEAIAGAAAGVFALAQSAWYLVGRSRAALAQRANGLKPVGGLAAHVGVAVMALAVVGAASGRVDREATLRPGEIAALEGYSIRYHQVRTEQLADRSRVIVEASVRASSDEVPIATILDYFPRTTAAIVTPAILSGAVGDLYVIVTNVDPATGTARFQLSVRPFMAWLWLGGGIAAGGGAIALLPGGRRKRAPASALPTVPVAAEAADVRV